ncbi:MAG: alpha/beta hydrolase [Actinobacteria bacterium]|nr:alpha/beta hydrolase [Actinomycetota bacterium]
MSKRKTIFIIPGYRQRPENKAYKDLAKIVKAEGYNPVLISIPWKQTTISENCEYFLKLFKKINADEKYILGFSFGAMIAFLASTKISVSGLILCSLSPYFKEDLSELDENWLSRRFFQTSM